MLKFISIVHLMHCTDDIRCMHTFAQCAVMVEWL